MILEEVSRNYCLTMTVEETLTATQMDFEELDSKLIDLGASEVQIDGHLGPHLFFCATSEDAHKIANKAKELILEAMWP